MKQLPGPRPPTPTAPEPKKHQWESDWLNQPNGEKVCRVCGVTKLDSGLNIRADRVVLNSDGSKSQMNHYIDIHGKRVSTIEDLSCPVHIGDPASAAAQAKEGVRNVKGRVGVVETRMETVEDRLDRLEAENASLREDLDRKQVIDGQALMEFLTDMAAAAARTRQIEAVNARGEQYHIPRQLVDVIDAVSVEIPEREPVLIPSKEESG